MQAVIICHDLKKKDPLQIIMAQDAVFCEGGMRMIFCCLLSRILPLQLILVHVTDIALGTNREFPWPTIPYFYFHPWIQANAKHIE
jgi:hypothetical protein